MNWKETFYTGKREHPQEKKPASLTALLMPSLLGVAMCLVCLCSLTWAWFTATQLMTAPEPRLMPPCTKFRPPPFFLMRMFSRGAKAS